MALVESRVCSHSGSIHSTHSTHWSTSASHLPLYNARTSHPASSPEALEQLSASLRSVDLLELDDLGGHGNRAPPRQARHENRTHRPTPTSLSSPSSSEDARQQQVNLSARARDSDEKRSFHRWMRSIRRRAMLRSSAQSTPGSGLVQNKSSNEPHQGRLLHPHQHRKMSSDSSLAFVTAVRSASVSLASMSALARSKRPHTRSIARSRTERSSRTSFAGTRISEDSAIQEQSVLSDMASIQRAAQRRRVLEELVSTEESYIGDLRFLMNVYITILASMPTLPAGLRTSINHNLTEIVQLHEEILGELHRVIPDSEYTQPQIEASMLPIPATGLSQRGHSARNDSHRRWKSLDGGSERSKRVQWLHNVPGILSEPQIAADVSKIFGKKLSRFFIYKEYGAKYELMIKDVAAAHQSMPYWDSHQKGFETLASTIGSTKALEDEARRALTVGDLLVKPVQRICKYPLLFSELLKCTPVCDCPNSHMEINDVLMRLREATAEINRATNDIHTKSTLKKTWLLQDRLVFPGRTMDSTSKNQIRSFGHMQLCGTLHICWQTKDGVQGQYLVCILYRDVLCLATAGRIEPVYTIVACIDLAGVRVAEVDNGRGLQCHTAPHSWKLIFESDYQLYELIMTACTPKEELEWRARLNRPPTEDFGLRYATIHNPLDLDIKSLGTIYGKQGTVARRISIHRATTIGPKSPLCQVVLKNTSALKDSSNHSNLRLGIHRSQSLLTTNLRLPVLAPARSERARLENLLTDVWSRDILPYPGITGRGRSEHLMRASASSVMRKLSVASITSSFSKKSGSLPQSIGLADTTNDEAELIQAEELPRGPGRINDASDEKPSSTSNMRQPAMASPVDWVSTPADALFEKLILNTNTVRQSSSDRTHTDSTDGAPTDTTAATEVLQASPANSIVLGPAVQFETKAVAPRAKENEAHHIVSRSKSFSRWATKGSEKGVETAHSIRNLFR